MTDPWKFTDAQREAARRLSDALKVCFATMRAIVKQFGPLIEELARAEVVERPQHGQPLKRPLTHRPQPRTLHLALEHNARPVHRQRAVRGQRRSPASRRR